MFAPAGLEPGQGVGLKNNETQFNLVKRHHNFGKVVFLFVNGIEMDILLINGIEKSYP